MVFLKGTEQLPFVEVCHAITMICSEFIPEDKKAKRGQLLSHLPGTPEKMAVLDIECCIHVPLFIFYSSEKAS